MRRPTTTQWLRIACLLAITALALMTWSLFDPRPGPVLIALSIGQAIGTASFVTFLTVVAWDIRRRPPSATDSLVLSQRRPAVGAPKSE